MDHWQESTGIPKYLGQHGQALDTSDLNTQTQTGLAPSLLKNPSPQPSKCHDLQRVTRV